MKTQSAPGHPHGDPLSPLPSWAALERTEWELRHLREHQASQMQVLAQSLERAILGARREESRLVERVEQDSRDIRCHLENLQRANAAAVREARMLISRRLQQLAQLRQQIQKKPKQDQLLQRALQLLQPWEITLSLKSASLWPRSQPGRVTFGEVQVQDLSVSFAVETNEMQGPQVSPNSEREPASRSPRGMRKTFLSSAAGEDLHFPRSRCRPLLEDTVDGTLSQEGPSPLGLHTQGMCKFQAVPSAPGSGESEGVDRNGDETQRAAGGLRNEGIQVLLTSCHSSSGRKGRCYCSAGPSKYIPATAAFPRIPHRHPLVTQSCMDLNPRGCRCFCLNNQPFKKSKGMVKTPSPANSPSSNSPWDSKCSPNKRPHLSRSMLELSPRSLSSSTEVRHRLSSAVHHWFSLASPTLKQTHRIQGGGVDLLRGPHGVKQACRPLFMPVLGRGGTAEPAEIEDSRHTPETGRLLRRFGKQGSGRADFSLPTGVHATAQGKLFVVDCGNARVQIMDSRGLVLQQVFSSHAEGSSGRRYDYVDVAVSAKGLIALSCASPRALLIFNRHGRHLQTFGGTGLGVKGELEAPQGVTVSRLDQFLVADIRRGSLIVLKLEHTTGAVLESIEIQGFHRPCMVSANLTTGLVAVSERGCQKSPGPCVKVLGSGWTVIRTVGVCSYMGAVLSYPWGVCIDDDGNVLVADWGQQYRVVLYSAQGVSQILVSQGLKNPRGLALLPERHLVVSDSMHHCIKVFQYK